MEDLTGRQIGHYRVVAPLGKDGMAMVYGAYQPSMERFVALKIFPRHFADPNFTGRFEQAAKTIAALEHPHILPVYDFGQVEEYTYLVMRYVEGRTLADLLQGRPLPLHDICHIISQIGDALDYAHSRGVVHRGIKPGNVLVDEQGNCLLFDFGIAGMIEATARSNATPLPGQIDRAELRQKLADHFNKEELSTLCFDLDIEHENLPGSREGMARELVSHCERHGRVPELVKACRRLRPNVSWEDTFVVPPERLGDIYFLGVMLYEMATGCPPFDAETPLPLPRTINPTLPEAVERVILKALAEKPEDRYQTAGEMARALEAATQHRRIPKWVFWILGGLGLVALAVAAGLLLSRGSVVPSSIATRATATATAAAAGPTTAAAIPTHAPSAATSIPIVIPPAGATSAPVTTQSVTPTAMQPTVPPSVTPVLPPIKIVRQFGVPGAAQSIAWDGSALWVAEGRFADGIKFLKLDDAGNTVEVYISGVSRGIEEPTGMVWVADSLWLSQNDSIREYKIEAGNVREVSRIAPPSWEGLSPFAGYAIAWDEQSFWLARSAYLTRMSPEWSSLTAFMHPEGVKALVWDGANLWALTARALEVVNIDGGSTPLASFTVPVPSPKSLAWDGQYLWALSDKIYQLDVSEARVYAAKQSRLRAEMTALTEVLRRNPQGEADRVDIINNTNRALKLSFEAYNYSVHVEPGKTKSITPPDNSFVAEVPGLPPIRGSYLLLSKGSCTWTFEVK